MARVNLSKNVFVIQSRAQDSDIWVDRYTRTFDTYTEAFEMASVLRTEISDLIRIVVHYTVETTCKEFAPEGKSFSWALEEMRKGNKVRRKLWSPKEFICTIVRHNGKELFIQNSGKVVDLKHSSILAHDWELMGGKQ